MYVVKLVMREPTTMPGGLRASRWAIKSAREMRVKHNRVRKDCVN